MEEKSNEQRPSHLVRFGQTDLHVSRLCQGTAFRNMPRAADNPMGLRVLQYCVDVGVNFFDSSNAYGWGGAEETLGKAMRDGAIRWLSAPKSRHHTRRKKRVVRGDRHDLPEIFCLNRQKAVSDAYRPTTLISTCSISRTRSRQLKRSSIRWMRWCGRG